MSPQPSGQLLQDLQPWTGHCRKITLISGGITNRNYRIDSELGSFVLRLPGEHTEQLGINRKYEFNCLEITHQVGVGAEVIAFLENHQALLCRFIPNALPLTSQTASEPERLQRIVKFIRRYHNAPAFPSCFCPFQTVRNYYSLSLQLSISYPRYLSETFAHMEEIERTLHPHARQAPCHNDLLPGNLLDDGQKIWIVDWEYAGNGNLFFDLGNFAVNLELDPDRCQQLVALYFGHATPILLAQLHLMCLASDLREAFWGFLQSGLSALDFDFVGYGNKHLARFRTNASQPEYQRWLAELK